MPTASPLHSHDRLPPPPTPALPAHPPHPLSKLPGNLTRPLPFPKLSATFSLTPGVSPTSALWPEAGRTPPPTQPLLRPLCSLFFQGRGCFRFPKGPFCLQADGKVLLPALPQPFALIPEGRAPRASPGSTSTHPPRAPDPQPLAAGAARPATCPGCVKEPAADATVQVQFPKSHAGFLGVAGTEGHCHTSMGGGGAPCLFGDKGVDPRGREGQLKVQFRVAGFRNGNKNPGESGRGSELQRE